MGETQELPLVGVGLGGDDDPPHVDATGQRLEVRSQARREGEMWGWSRKK